MLLIEDFNHGTTRNGYRSTLSTFLEDANAREEVCQYIAYEWDCDQDQMEKLKNWDNLSLEEKIDCVDDHQTACARVYNYRLIVELCESHNVSCPKNIFEFYESDYMLQNSY